ncbi:MAG: tetratricopeptide repeat protein, partial [Microcoleaceae cyanobacterium]
MLRKKILVGLFVTFSWAINMPAVMAQSLLPFTLELDQKQLEETGLSLAEEAVQLARFQQLPMALGRAQLATQLAPTRYQTWALLGSLYIQNEELDAGIVALQKAQVLAPQEAEILFVLGRAYFQQNDFVKAIANLEKGLKIKPEAPNALFDLGNAYYKQASYDRAIAQYEKAIALDKNIWPALNNIG